MSINTNDKAQWVITKVHEYTVQALSTYAHMWTGPEEAFSHYPDCKKCIHQYNRIYKQKYTK